MNVRQLECFRAVMTSGTMTRAAELMEISQPAVSNLVASLEYEIGFKLFYCSFIVLGSSIQLGALIDLSDALIFLVAIPNLLGLYLLAPVLKEEVLSYRERLGRY